MRTTSQEILSINSGPAKKIKVVITSSQEEEEFDGPPPSFDSQSPSSLSRLTPTNSPSSWQLSPLSTMLPSCTSTSTSLQCCSLPLTAFPSSLPSSPREAPLNSSPKRHEMEETVEKGPFKTTIHYQHLLYKGQKVGSSAVSRLNVVTTVEAQSTKEWKEKIWEKVSPFIRGHFEIVDEKLNVTSLKPSDARDFQRYSGYVLVRPASSHIVRSLGDVSLTILKNMTGSSIIFKSLSPSNIMQSEKGALPTPVQVYEFGFIAKQLYDKIAATLKDDTPHDKSDAVITSEKIRLIRELKKMHGSTLMSPTDLPWMAWAETIFKAKPDDREELIKGAPPLQVIHLFRLQGSKSEKQLHQMTAQTRDVLQVIDSLIQENIDTFNFVKAVFEKKDAFLRGQKASLMATLSDLKATETDVSNQYANEVTDQIDVDHL